MGLFSTLGLGAGPLFWQQGLSPFVNPADYPEIPGLPSHEDRMKRIQELRRQVQGMMPNAPQQMPVAPEPPLPPKPPITINDGANSNAPVQAVEDMPAAGQQILDQWTGNAPARQRGAQSIIAAMENRIPGSSLKGMHADVWNNARNMRGGDWSGQVPISTQQANQIQQNIAGANATPQAYEAGMGPQLRPHWQRMIDAPDRSQDEAYQAWLKQQMEQEELQERLKRVAPAVETESDSPVDAQAGVQAGYAPAGSPEAIARRLERITLERQKGEGDAIQKRLDRAAWLNELADDSKLVGDIGRAEYLHAQAADMFNRPTDRQMTSAEMVSRDPAQQQKWGEYMEHLSPKNQMAARVMALEQGRLGQLYRRDYPEYVRVTGGGEGGYEDAQIAAAEANARQLYARGDQAGGDRAMQYAQMLRHYKAQRMDTEARSQQAAGQHELAKTEAERTFTLQTQQLHEQRLGNWLGRQSEIKKEWDQMTDVTGQPVTYTAAELDAETTRQMGYPRPGTTQGAGTSPSPTQPPPGLDIRAKAQLQAIKDTNEYRVGDLYELLDTHYDQLARLKPDGWRAIAADHGWTKYDVIGEVYNGLKNTQGSDGALAYARILRSIGFPTDKLPRKSLGGFLWAWNWDAAKAYMERIFNGEIDPGDWGAMPQEKKDKKAPPQKQKPPPNLAPEHPGMF